MRRIDVFQPGVKFTLRTIKMTEMCMESGGEDEHHVLRKTAVCFFKAGLLQLK